MNYKIILLSFIAAATVFSCRAESDLINVDVEKDNQRFSTFTGNSATYSRNIMTGGTDYA